MTIITVQVREDSSDFHGVVAHVCIKGDGSPYHFEVAKRVAMEEAGRGIQGAFSGEVQATSALRSLTS